MKYYNILSGQMDLNYYILFDLISFNCPRTFSFSGLGVVRNDRKNGWVVLLRKDTPFRSRYALGFSLSSRYAFDVDGDAQTSISCEAFGASLC